MEYNNQSHKCSNSNQLGNHLATPIQTPSHLSKAYVHEFEKIRNDDKKFNIQQQMKFDKIISRIVNQKYLGMAGSKGAFLMKLNFRVKSKYKSIVYISSYMAI